MSTSTSSISLPAMAAAQDPWEINYVNESHVQAFARALDISDTAPIEGDLTPSSPKSPPLGATPPNAQSEDKLSTFKYGPDNGAFSSNKGERVEKLTATSDFAPIHQRVSRRKGKSVQQGMTYHLMRWPLLGFFFTIIWLEFSAYVITRQIVNVFEYSVAWWGHKARLRQEMRKSKTYDEWTASARKLDRYLGFDQWKEADEDPYFDYVLVKRVRRTLTRLRMAKDTRALMDALAVCVRSNFAGTEGVKMYSETFYGTKTMVEQHIREVATSLDFIRTATDVSLEEKRAFFRAINKNYGSSALCLSGGASFGYYHFGVIRAFLEADLLPRVVTGTSAGALAAALLCTRTDEELKVLLVPRLADKITACSEPFTVWFRRFRKTGARFDSVEWAKKAMFFTGGSLTFKEAYERTGRALNVSVVPSDRHSPTILLNHLTAPNCLIWSAILASAAVPGILNPVVLMAKDRNGNVKPHNLGGSRFKDGSLREDIPLGSLHTQFNCNFSIVSQTNPHIHLFFFAPRGSVGRPVAHRKGKGWRGGFILSALESYIKLDLTKHFKANLLPQLLQSDWSGVFLQRFSGDLTLTPRSTIGDWARILSDPNREQLARMIQVGQRVSWPALHMVSNRLHIERAILRGRAEVRVAVHRERPTTDSSHLTNINLDGLPSSAYVPIESDADAGFLHRTRKARAARPVISTGRTLEEIPSIRKRRPNGIRENNESVSEPPPTLATATKATSTTQDGPPIPMATERPSSFTDTLRHVRTQSMAAITSPFRSPSTRSTKADQVDPQPRKSQMSISRWFGNASDSDSDEEGDLAHLSGENGAGTPRFSTGVLNGESAIADEPSSVEEGEGEGDTSMPSTNSGSRSETGSIVYSPPQQDAS
ncbi:acyl transferase/acyl hydrolase/lysophospholipase [Kockovaella imperatae]|uniref:Patatin-like phospholipase domain-containing protein n=1 Tax=Kockovaella imperatae TaxID=4999 RepID=A0A1Y1UIN0_9TREE|nr:acyl transferase/acyl hydrolase/lysophospholipase [Kockovaella imperatae]ORX37891.1 acyl transferase/acyl hydrolase/lysophospholipase [Kockovaella imperatae]